MGKIIKGKPGGGAKSQTVRHGASNANRPGPGPVDVNGIKAGMNKTITNNSSGSDPTSGKTVKGSTSIPQHKKLAMTGKT